MDSTILAIEVDHNVLDIEETLQTISMYPK